MANSNKKIDDFLEQNLRKSSLVQPRSDFQALLMQKVIAEHKRLVEETRKERIVKYVLSSFSTLMIGFTIVMGYLSGKSGNVNPSGDIAVEQSNNLVSRLVSAVQSVFLYVLNFFGVSISPSTLNIALIIILVVGVFLMGERLFLRGKYKSNVKIAKH
jgi:hypothetical protein